MSMPDIEKLREFFQYDPETGKVFRIKPISVKDRNSIGSEVGNLDPSGYLRTKILGHRVGVHNLIWALQKGYWPTSIVDHKNRVRHDNRWENLRLASERENKHNAVIRPNLTGFRGVIHRKDTYRSKPYRAQIRLEDGTRKILGDFCTAEEASSVYEAAAMKLHGEFYVGPENTVA